MRKHVLFLVHGMGAYVRDDGSADDSWSDKAAAELKTVFGNFPGITVAFEDFFEVININYDTVFNDLIQRWATEAETIIDSGIEAAAPVEKMVSWLTNGAETDDNFAWTHAGDVILYRFINLVRQRVKVHVANQFHDALQPNADGPVIQWSVIAHSLGTIVTHDVLHAMDSTTPNEQGISILDATVPNANIVAMLANVSKRLETNVKVYESAVVPPGVCDIYLNANNRYDPFVNDALLVPERFKPVGLAAWDKAAADDAYLDVEIENIHEINVHSFKNYIVNPAVHIPILEALVGFGSISQAEKDNAVSQFQNLPFPSKQQDLENLTQPMDQDWFSLTGTLLPDMESMDEEP